MHEDVQVEAEQEASSSKHELKIIARGILEVLDPKVMGGKTALAKGVGCCALCLR
jgi:hypothetical protein